MRFHHLRYRASDIRHASLALVIAASITFAGSLVATASQSQLRNQLLASLRADTAEAMRLHQSGDHKAAIQAFEKIAATVKARLGASTAIAAQALNNLALAYDVSGALTDAARTYREALDIVEQAAPRHSVQRAEISNNLAAVILQQCRLDDAQKLYRQALVLSETALGAHHQDTLMVRSNVERLDRYLGVAETGSPRAGTPQHAMADTISPLLSRCTS